MANAHNDKKVDEEGKKSYTRPAPNEKSNSKQSDLRGHDPVQDGIRDRKKANLGNDSTGSSNKQVQTKDKKALYFKTVEEWKPGDSRIVCPACGYEGQPMVRRQRNKACKSKLGAACMLGCWPLCVLPFLLCPNETVNLHCCQCSWYLDSPIPINPGKGRGWRCSTQYW